MTTYRELFRVQAFRDLWIGQTVSQLGDSLYFLIFLFMVDRITGSAAMVGAAGVAQSLPFLLLSPYAGVVADRADRRLILLRTDVLSAFTLLALSVLVWFDPTPPAEVLIAAGALLSAINVFFAPAKGAAIPQIVPPALLTTANALSLATQNLMPMIGIAVSGTVLAALYAVSPRYFFLSAIGLNAVSFLVSAGFVRRLPPLVPEREAGQFAGANRTLDDLRDGLAYLKSERVLWTMLFLNLLVQLVIAPFMLVYVRVNREWFGGGFGTLALCEVSFFAGVVLCSLFLERLRIRRAGLAFIGGMAVIGLTIMFMAGARTAPLFAFWNFAAGLAFPFAQIPMTTYVQRSVPESLQGRVNSVMAMTGLGVQPIGIGLGGLLLASLGPAWLLVLMGAGMALAALGGLFAGPFRRATVPPATTGPVSA